MLTIFSQDIVAKDYGVGIGFLSLVVQLRKGLVLITLKRGGYFREHVLEVEFRV
jgi:hypothetical protein